LPDPAVIVQLVEIAAAGDNGDGPRVIVQHLPARAITAATGRPLPNAVIVLPNDVERTVCADDENLELLVGRLVHSGQWRTCWRKAGIGQADRRMPGAVVILPATFKMPFLSTTKTSSCW